MVLLSVQEAPASTKVAADLQSTRYFDFTLEEIQRLRDVQE